MNKLYIYYSLTGNGDYIGEILSSKGFEIRKIKAKDKMPKSFIGQIMTGGFLSLIGYKAKLLDFDYNITNYDEIIIGSPIWNDRLACPINTLLDKIDFKSKKVTFILYSGSGKSNHATRKIIDKYKDVNIINIREPLKNKNIVNDKLKDL